MTYTEQKTLYERIMKEVAKDLKYRILKESNFQYKDKHPLFESLENIDSFKYNGKEWKVGQTLYAMNADNPPYVFINTKIKRLHWYGRIDNETGEKEWKYYEIIYDLEYKGHNFKNQTAFLGDSVTNEFPYTNITEKERDDFGLVEIIYGRFYISIDKQQIIDGVKKYLRDEVWNYQYAKSEYGDKMGEFDDKINDYNSKIDILKNTQFN